MLDIGRLFRSRSSSSGVSSLPPPPWCRLSNPQRCCGDSAWSWGPGPGPFLAPKGPAPFQLRGVPTPSFARHGSGERGGGWVDGKVWGGAGFPPPTVNFGCWARDPGRNAWLGDVHVFYKSFGALKTPPSFWHFGPEKAPTLPPYLQTLSVWWGGGEVSVAIYTLA